jgi:hypothetical protein
MQGGDEELGASQPIVQQEEVVQVSRVIVCFIFACH